MKINHRNIHCIFKNNLCLLFIIACFFIRTSCVFAQINVVTQHNDIGRTGWYNTETVLNKKNVSNTTFGKLFTRKVDGQMYAQPLIVSNVNIPNLGNRNIVYLSTVNNTVYAYDADSANVLDPYWKINLTPVNSRPILQKDLYGACPGNFLSFIGIVGTPVIDTLSNTIYLVARSIDTVTKVVIQNLHVLDIRTGSEKPNSPVQINAAVFGNGDGNVNGVVNFDPLRNNQRPGLLLLNGVVYIGFSSHCDWGPYHGWILGYDVNTLKQTFVYNATPNGYNGGIWMSGTGIAADSSGNLYFATGNGSVGNASNPSNLINRSESVIRINPNDTNQPVKDFFTPNNYEILEAGDLDLGTSGVMIIPNSNRAITGCKDGNLYLLNQYNLGGYNTSFNNNVQTINLGNAANMHAQFTFYGGTKKEYAYFWPENTALKAIPFKSELGLLDETNIVTSGIQGPVGQTGAMLSVSSNDRMDSTAILWASYPQNCDGENYNCPGILRALDAADVTKELWNSGTYLTDNSGTFAKFSSPVIANGKVYLGTFSNQLIVYGLKINITDTCIMPNIALNKPAHASSESGSNLLAAAAVDGNSNTRWSSVFQDQQYFFIDLQKRYDICNVHVAWETALGKDFQIQLSDDSTHWVTVADITNNTLFSNLIPVKATARYVRLYGITRGTAYGFSIYEFEIFGQLSAIQCVSPNQFSVSNIYENSATLNLNNNGSDKFLINYKTVAENIWKQVVTSDMKIDLKNLNCGTDYYYTVQGICSLIDTSNILVIQAFSTLECGSNCGLLPSRWSSQDIGASSIIGSSCYSKGIYTLRASGADIWDATDQFHYANVLLTGDGTITARVNVMDKSDPWNKCGIMFRESLDPSSRHAFVSLTSGNGVAFQYRQTTDSYSTNSNVSELKAPYWIRLVKVNSSYTAYSSKDSLSWVQVGNTVDLGFGTSGPVYCGLALTSHNNNILSEATIDHLSALGFTDYQLLNFSGEHISGQQVKLNWTTTLELNTDYFILERSFDNINFYEIDSKNAKNNGKFTANYSYIDSNARQSPNFYRLKIIDKLGNYQYSNLVVIRIFDAQYPIVWPNPAQQVINISKGSENITQINVYDILGRRVAQINNIDGLNFLQINSNNFSIGVYVVEIRTDKNVYRNKIIKR